MMFINLLIPGVGDRVAYNLDLNNSNIELGFEIPYKRVHELFSERNDEGEIIINDQEVTVRNN